jgi:hypothetical protein
MVGNAIPNESGSNWDLPSGVLPYLLEWVIMGESSKPRFCGRFTNNLEGT